jgi:hypothetical protein
VDSPSISEQTKEANVEKVSSEGADAFENFDEL